MAPSSSEKLVESVDQPVIAICRSVHTVMRRSGAPENKMGNAGSIFDGIMLRQKATETPAADDRTALFSYELFSNTFDIVDDLVKSVGFRS